VTGVAALRVAAEFKGQRLFLKASHSAVAPERCQMTWNFCGLVARMKVGVGTRLLARRRLRLATPSLSMSSHPCVSDFQQIVLSSTLGVRLLEAVEGVLDNGRMQDSCLKAGQELPLEIQAANQQGVFAYAVAAARASSNRSMNPLVFCSGRKQS